MPTESTQPSSKKQLESSALTGFSSGGRTLSLKDFAPKFTNESLIRKELGLVIAFLGRSDKGSSPVKPRNLSEARLTNPRSVREMIDNPASAMELFPELGPEMDRRIAH